MGKPFQTMAFVLMLTLLAGAPRADEAPTPPVERAEKLGLFAGVGYLGSPGAHGASLNTGLRLAMGRHLALSLDLGYGVISASPTIQDRWWVIPAVAGVLSAGRMHFDLGAGLGFGAASGYISWPAYAAAPFTPVWAFQLIPAVRAHALAAFEVSHDVDVFARVDVASLVLGGNSLGFRDGNPRAGVTDTMWVTCWLGVQLGVL